MDTKDTLAKAMVNHWDWAASEGLMTKATAATIATSCRRVLGVEPDWEMLDVQKLNVDYYISKFNRLKSEQYKPRSLQNYVSRFRRAVASYLRYLDDPASWRFAPSHHRSASRLGGSPSPQRQSHHHGDERVNTMKKSSGTTLQEYAFPIRQDCMAKLVIPRDVKTSEINRLVAWVRTLAVDYEPAP